MDRLHSTRAIFLKGNCSTVLGFCRLHWRQGNEEEEPMPLCIPDEEEEPMLFCKNMKIVVPRSLVRISLAFRYQNAMSASHLVVVYLLHSE
jgi:hypothetical protein